MKKAFLKVICMGVIIAVLFGMICLTGCSTIKKYINKADNAVLDYEDNGGEIQIQRATSVLNAESGYVEETVTAILTPSTVANKAVDWSIEWADNAPLKTSAISDYLTVTPDSDGSLTAKVRCYKSFRGSSAVLYVTSRNSGAKGSCIVYFVGKPSSLTVDVSNLSTQWRGKILVCSLNKGSTYTQDIILSNKFNDVGEDYKNLTLDVSGIGSFVQGTANITSAGYTWSYEENVALDSVKDKYIAVSIVNGKLVIEAKGRYEEEKGNYVGGSSSGSIMAGRYKEDTTDSMGFLPYYNIIVKASNSKVLGAIQVYICEGVSNVDITPTEISF